MKSPNHIVVHHNDLTPLQEAIAGIENAQAGWLNVSPHIAADIEIPPTPGPLAIFSKRGPAVPIATWVATHSGRSGVLAPAELGLLHPAARPIVPIIETPLPPCLRTTQDHPKRGFVAQAQPPIDIAAVSLWIALTVLELCRVPAEGDLDVLLYS